MQTLTLFLVRFRWHMAVFMFGAGSVASAQVVVTWQAATTNGIGTASGTPLLTGSLVELGMFTVNDATIQTNANNYGFLSAHFVIFDSAAIGTGSGAEGIDGYWTRASPGNVSTDGIGVAGQRMYIWAFDTVSGATATQYGIYTSSLSSWLFPSDSSVPNTSQIDLNEVTSILVGGFGTGTSSATGPSEPLYNLAAIAIPEPASTAMIAALGALTLGLYRRRFLGRK